jgi:PEP-CTERM motif
MTRVLFGVALVTIAATLGEPSWATVGPVTPIPEPSTLSILAAGIAAAVVGMRLRNRK